MSRIGDRYPNYLSGSITLSAANTFTTTVETLPIVRPVSGRGRSTIMEFLWIDVDPKTIDLVADNDSFQFTMSTGSAPTAIPELDEGSTIALLKLEQQLATSGATLVKGPMRIDLTDKNGFGQLVATDRINVSATSNGQAAACEFNWRIYYRYVTVGAEEYIGIVQSQTMG